MQLSESLLLHWRHWMRSMNDTAREAFQCKRYLCSSACAQLTCVSPCAIVVIFAGLGVSEHTNSSTHVPFELKGCTLTISDVYLPVGRMTIQGCHTRATHSLPACPMGRSR